MRAGGARSVRYLAGFGVGVKYGVHTDTLRNLARAVVERVFYTPVDGKLVATLQPKHNVFRRLAYIRHRLLRKLKPTPVVPREEYPYLYVGRKRKVYERALASLETRALTVKDSWVNTFVKAEKINFSAKVDPAPRAIQPRTPRFLLEVGKYLKPFEKELYAAFRRVFGYDVILKGKNASETAEVLAGHWQRFKSPVAVGLDASRFDQHVSYEALRFEHSIYNSVFRSPELARLLKMQLENKGVAHVEGHRVEYTVRGCRMSGDINTSLGNCLIMSSIVLAYCEHYGVNVRLANNGDDCVLILDKTELHKLSTISQWMRDFGFRLTQEAPVYELEKIVFCQAQPVLTGNGWRMVRDPRTAMSKDCVSLLSWANDQDFSAWAGAIGACGGALTAGVPVWASWYARLSRLGTVKDGAMEFVYDSGLGYMSRGVKPCDITAECRVSFYKAFGIEPDLQESLEADYSEAITITRPSPMIFNDIEALDSENPLATWLKINTL